MTKCHVPACLSTFGATAENKLLLGLVFCN
jgi:hypothetical protein